MRPALSALIIAFSILACDKDATLSNDTRPGGYAMGEKVSLNFSLPELNNPPAFIAVSVLEKKTNFIYSLRARLESRENVCRYACIWDGRKPDGRWPEGGPYLIYATAELKQTVYSDTVEIGLAD